ncbi:MAG: polysaccharide pyruvyl transferase family protein [Ferruginibacter sp.]
MKKVFLITKLKTTNLGNEALSNEIISLFSGISNDVILNVNGRPFGLDGYYPKRIINQSDPVAVLDKWADKIVAKIKKEAGTGFNKQVPAVKLLKNDSGDLKNESIRAKLRPLKRVIVSFFPYWKEYRQRASTLKNADWLIYSGAGEVGDNIVFLRQLVEIRVAQKLGIKTAAVNQSVVIKTDPFKKLVGHVYGNMSKIVIRGTTTRENLISYGVPGNIIEVAPDSAINAAFPPSARPQRDPLLVGINITPRIKITEEEIGKVVAHIRSLGRKLIFITNEPFEDSKVSPLFTEKLGVEFVKNFSSYHEYMKQLASCDFVISARLHTNILSLDTHTPIIPIEGNVFKSTELLKQLEYPVKTLNSQDEGWVNQLIREIDLLHNRKYDFDAYFSNTFPKHQQAVKRNAAWINEIN